MLTHSIPQSFVLKERMQAYAHHAIQILAGSLFIALCSQIKIPLPFTMIPLSLQTLAVLLLGGLFGRKQGAWMVLTYFAEIAVGMPVLAGGISDPLVFIGPRAGYVMGFLVQVYSMGWFIERMPRFNAKKVLGASLLACSFNLGLGVCWLSHFVGWNAVWMMGFYPFVPGEVLKALAATALLKSYRFSRDSSASHSYSL